MIMWVVISPFRWKRVHCNSPLEQRVRKGRRTHFRRDVSIQSGHYCKVRNVYTACLVTPRICSQTYHPISIGKLCVWVEVSALTKLTIAVMSTSFNYSETQVRWKTGKQLQIIGNCTSTPCCLESSCKSLLMISFRWHLDKENCILLQDRRGIEGIASCTRDGGLVTFMI